MKHIKKLTSLILVFVLIISMSTSVFAAENGPCAIEVVEEDLTTGSARSINKTGTNITIKGGESKKFTFTMSNGFLDLGTPHNAFNVRINNVSTGAKYTLSITYDGTELWNKQYTGDAAVDVWNCSKSQQWIVLIINDSSRDLSLNYSITSFIK